MTAGNRLTQALRAAAFFALLSGWTHLLAAEPRPLDSDGDNIPDAQDNLPALATLPLHWAVQGVEIHWIGLEPGPSSAWDGTNALTLFSHRERNDRPGSRIGAGATASPLDPLRKGSAQEDGLVRLGLFGSDEVPWQAVQRRRARCFAANPAGRGRGVRLRFEVHFRNLSGTDWHLRGLGVPILADGHQVATAQPENPALVARGIVFPGGSPRRVYGVVFTAEVPADQTGRLFDALEQRAPRFAFEHAEGWIVSESQPEDLPLATWFAGICRQTVPVRLRGGDGQVLVWRMARTVAGARQSVASWAETLNDLSRAAYGRPFWLEEHGVLTSLAGWDTGAWDRWWRLVGCRNADGWRRVALKHEIVFELGDAPLDLPRAARKRAAAAADNPILLSLLGHRSVRAGDAAAAVAWFRQAAVRGYAPGLFALGRALAEGRGAETNEVLASHACRQAAGQGYAPAAAWLGGALLRGVGGRVRDPAAGAAWLGQAAAQGHPAGLGLYALCLTRGVGVAIEAPEGLELTRRAAAQGDATAQLALAIQLLATGAPEAIDWLACAAEGGDAKAQARLGRCLETGEGIARDPAAAVVWYARAAAQGEATAQLALGRALRRGLGVKCNPRRAAYWFRQAAEQGNLEAQTWWGLALLDGQGVDRDTARGLDWIRRAAGRGHSQAQYLLGLCTYAGLGGMAAEPAAALRWFKAAADQQVLPARIFVGFCYYDGRGTTQDRGEAFRHFREAAERGSAIGQIWLAHCYAFGEGVETDLNRAREWAQEAWRQGHPGGRQMLRRIPGN